MAEDKARRPQADHPRKAGVKPRSPAEATAPEPKADHAQGSWVKDAAQAYVDQIREAGGPPNKLWGGNFDRNRPNVVSEETLEEVEKQIDINCQVTEIPVGNAEELLPDDANILALAGAAFIAAFNASSDSGKEAQFRRVVQQTGHGDLLRPEAATAAPAGSSGLSTMEPAKQPELPDHPPAWWRDREPGMTPDKWIETYYKQYIPAGLTRSFFQRPGQDKALYNALHQWEQQPQGGIPGAPKNQLPPDLYLPTKSELLDRQLNGMGGKDAVIRQGTRLYQAARRYG